MSDLGNKEVMARNIRKYMEQCRKDRNQICHDLGFKYSTFTDWVNGKKYPRIDKIELMANYFGIQKSDLIEDEPQKTDELTFDDFTYALHNETKELTDENKEKLLEMARLFKLSQEHDEGK